MPIFAPNVNFAKVKQITESIDAVHRYNSLEFCRHIFQRLGDIVRLERMGRVHSVPVADLDRVGELSEQDKG